MAVASIVIALAALSVVVALAAKGLRAFTAFARSQPDPAWKPTGVRQLHEGHDESKATAARKASADREARRRRVEAGPSPRAARRSPTPFDQKRRVG